MGDADGVGVADADAEVADGDGEGLDGDGEGLEGLGVGDDDGEADGVALCDGDGLALWGGAELPWAGPTRFGVTAG